MSDATTDTSLDLAPAAAAEFDRQYAAEQIRRSRHPLRRLIKGFYLRDILADARGPTIDFGCGAGQLLRRLPAGSLGLEVNPHLIDALRREQPALELRQARGDATDFELPGVDPERYRTLVIAHVLEHLPDPARALRTLLGACRRIGVERVIVIVPGARGYASDRTHKTFIDRAYLDRTTPAEVEGFARSRPRYFPGPWAWIGRHFVFHEMKVVFDRAPARR